MPICYSDFPSGSEEWFFMISSRMDQCWLFKKSERGFLAICICWSCSFNLANVKLWLYFIFYIADLKQPDSWWRLIYVDHLHSSHFCIFSMNVISFDGDKFDSLGVVPSIPYYSVDIVISYTYNVIARNFCLNPCLRFFL